MLEKAQSYILDPNILAVLLKSTRGVFRSFYNQIDTPSIIIDFAYNNNNIFNIYILPPVVLIKLKRGLTELVTKDKTKNAPLLITCTKNSNDFIALVGRVYESYVGIPEEIMVGDLEKLRIISGLNINVLRNCINQSERAFAP